MLRHLDSSTPTTASDRAAPGGAGLSRSAAPADSGGIEKQIRPSCEHCCRPATVPGVDQLPGPPVVQTVISGAPATFAHPSVPPITLASVTESVTYLSIECVTRWSQKGAAALPKDRRFWWGRGGMSRALQEGGCP